VKEVAGPVPAGLSLPTPPARPEVKGATPRYGRRPGGEEGGALQLSFGEIVAGPDPADLPIPALPFDQRSRAQRQAWNGGRACRGWRRNGEGQPMSGGPDFLFHPLADQVLGGHSCGLGHLFHCIRLFRAQWDLNDQPPLENRPLNLFEFSLVVGKVVGIPEASEVVDGVSPGNLVGIHRLAQLRYRRFSRSVIGRAVIGYPLPSGKEMTIQNRWRPAAVCPST